MFAHPGVTVRILIFPADNANLGLGINPFDHQADIRSVFDFSRPATAAVHPFHVMNACLIAPTSDTKATDEARYLRDVMSTWWLNNGPADGSDANTLRSSRPPVDIYVQDVLVDLSARDPWHEALRQDSAEVVKSPVFKIEVKTRAGEIHMVEVGF